MLSLLFARNVESLVLPVVLLGLDAHATLFSNTIVGNVCRSLESRLAISRLAIEREKVLYMKRRREGEAHLLVGEGGSNQILDPPCCRIRVHH